MVRYKLKVPKKAPGKIKFIVKTTTLKVKQSSLSSNVTT